VKITENYARKTPNAQYMARVNTTTGVRITNTNLITCIIHRRKKWHAGEARFFRQLCA